MNSIIPGGTVHKIPSEFKKILSSKPKALSTWLNLTPLARNEWICWIEYVKKAETRNEHIQRALQELSEGKRRPCCWYGCIHRTDKAISPSVQAVVLNKRKKRD